jgi:hypothetical protein
MIGTDNCVEVLIDTDVVLVRDSKHHDGPILRFGVDAWSQFLAGIDQLAADHPGTASR